MLVLAAKIAGAVALVVALVIVKPFFHSRQGSPKPNLEPYASGFQSPTYLAAAPGEPNRLYVVEQAGRIRYVVRRSIAGTLLDITSRVASGGERGLLSVAFSPHYERDHLFFVNYTDRHGDTRVVEFRTRAGHAVLSSARELLFVKQPYANHNGAHVSDGSRTTAGACSEPTRGTLPAHRPAAASSSSRSALTRTTTAVR